MKVKIKKYPSWLGPYQLVEKLCFWAKDVEDEYGIKDKPEWVFKLGDWLAHTWFGGVWSRGAQGWISYHEKRRVNVHIDRWDTWSMDHTLAHIVLPMLIQLKETKHGAPNVDLEDVPKDLHPKKQTKKQKDNGETDSTHFERWDWILDEMIFAFDSKVNDDWEEQFYSGEQDIYFEELNDGSGMSEMKYGPKDTFQVDRLGMQAYQNRISNGFRLFGKYYECLWD